ncbi:MAG: protoporphyrinogen oxidase [Bacteroidota bacterium]
MTEKPNFSPNETYGGSHVNFRVVVIGGGISGLTTAYWLKKKGFHVTVMEKQSMPGGTMQTLCQDGWLIETGPNSALETTPLFKELFRELQLTDELVYADPKAKKRYILRNNNLYALPMSVVPFLSSGLWSVGGKLRLLKEPFIGRAAAEESIAEFVERRLGKEFLDYAINPFVAGVFAGDPSKLSVRAAFPKLYALEKQYGGLVKGMIRGARERKKRGEVAKDRAEMFSFRSGMQVFPKALAASLGSEVMLNCSVEKVMSFPESKTPSYKIQYNREGNPGELLANLIIFAIPAYAVPGMIMEFKTSLPSLLDKIYYPPVAEVFLGYRKEQVGRPLDGFGFLVPEKENRKILGTIWSSVIFPGRAPDKSVEAFTSFVGGSRQPDLVNLPQEWLEQIVVDELHDIMKIEGKPLFSKVQKWERAIPQYHVGYHAVEEGIDNFQHQNPGIFICSNFKGGISVGDCVMNAHRTVIDITQYIQNYVRGK